MTKKLSMLSGAIALAISTGATAGVLPDKQMNNHWYTEAQTVIAKKMARIQESTAKNVIVFVGDGMGVSTLTSARILEG